MKTSSLLQGLGLAVIAALGSQSQAETPAMQDAATHQQLSQNMRKVAQEDPMKVLKATTGADSSVTNRPKSILAQSDIVCFGGYATLVPKRAILQIPKNFADRIRFQPGAKLQGWSDFYALNRGWITTVEVSRAQAEGKDPLAEETQQKLSKSGNLMVATYQGGPISVLPLKTPEATATTATTPTVKQP
jgi:septal ring-binding cell division protein DamX